MKNMSLSYHNQDWIPQTSRISQPHGVPAALKNTASPNTMVKTDQHSADLKFLGLMTLLTESAGWIGWGLFLCFDLLREVAFGVPGSVKW